MNALFPLLCLLGLIALGLFGAPLSSRIGVPATRREIERAKRRDALDVQPALVRKEWDAGASGAGLARESSDYIDGWNDALEAAASGSPSRARPVPPALKEFER